MPDNGSLGTLLLGRTRRGYIRVRLIDIAKEYKLMKLDSDCIPDGISDVAPSDAAVSALFFMTSVERF